MPVGIMYSLPSKPRPVSTTSLGTLVVSIVLFSARSSSGRRIRGSAYAASAVDCICGTHGRSPAAALTVSFWKCVLKSAMEGLTLTFGYFCWNRVMTCWLTSLRNAVAPHQAYVISPERAAGAVFGAAPAAGVWPDVAPLPAAGAELVCGALVQPDATIARASKIEDQSRRVEVGRITLDAGIKRASCWDCRVCRSTVRTYI